MPRCPQLALLLAGPQLENNETSLGQPQVVCCPIPQLVKTGIPSWTPWAERELIFAKYISSTRNQARCLIGRTSWLCAHPPPRILPRFVSLPKQHPISKSPTSWGLFLTWFLPPPNLWKAKSPPSLPLACSDGIL